VAVAVLMVVMVVVVVAGVVAYRGDQRGRQGLGPRRSR